VVFAKFASIFRTSTGISVTSVPFFLLLGCLAFAAMFPTAVLTNEWINENSKSEWLVVAIDRWIEATQTDGFLAWQEFLVRAGFTLLPLLPLAAALRAIRAKSIEPFWTTTWSLSLGLSSVLVLSWVARAGVWIYGFVRAFFDWWSNILAGDLPGWIQTTFNVLGIALLIAVAVIAVAALFSMMSASELRNSIFVARMFGLLAILTVLALAAFTWGPSRQLIELAIDAISFISTWTMGAAFWLMKGTVRFTLYSLTFLFFAGILTQIGTAPWVPIRSAWSAGSGTDTNADFVAGAGVAFSVVLTAASFNEVFGEWLARQLASLPYEVAIPLDFESLFPPAIAPIWEELFEAFIEFPELLLAAAILPIGLISLAFGGRGPRTSGTMVVATAAVIRALTAVVVTFAGLLLVKQVGDS
jgi:hypothetical protein